MIYEGMIEAPWGHICLQWSDKGINRLEFAQGEVKTTDICKHTELIQKFSDFFESADNGLHIMHTLSGTPYQKKVWDAISEIPSGQVRTYTELAEQLGSGPRAVANACRHNPCPLVVPCHRIVAKNGLGGYAGQTSGWLMDVKVWLLAHEGYHASR